MDVKQGDKVHVETNTGGGFYGVVRAISDSGDLKTYFIQRFDGGVSVHNELGVRLRHLAVDETYPDPPSPPPAPKYESRPPQPIPEMPSWTKGQMIRSGEELWQVTEVFSETDTLEITPLELSGHMSSYICKGEKYRLVKHECSYMGKGGIWEIPEEAMNRSSSQVLLYLWEDTGPSIEIDF